MFRSLRCVVLSALSVLVLHTAVKPVNGQYYYQAPRSYYRNDTFLGGLIGGAGGAAVGSSLGPKGNRAENALIGAGVGLLGGALVGKAIDNTDQRQVMHGSAIASQANAQVVQSQQVYVAQAVTTSDVVEMTRAGLGDDVIINAMRTRGSMVDTSPSSLVYLKQNGVSDRVVMAAQSAGRITVPVTVPPTAINAPPAPVIVQPQPVYVTPAPRVIEVYPYPHHYHVHRGW